MSGFGTDWAQRFSWFFFCDFPTLFSMYVWSLPWLFVLFLICGLLSSGALYSECWHTEMGLSIESILSLIVILDCTSSYSYCYGLLWTTISLYWRFARPETDEMLTVVKLNSTSSGIWFQCLEKKIIVCTYICSLSTSPYLPLIPIPLCKHQESSFIRIEKTCFCLVHM